MIPFRPSRVTSAQVDACIAREEYWRVPDTNTTVCALVLSNGYTVTGFSTMSDPDIYDAELGRIFAREKAREHIWQLESYLLRDKLKERSLSDVAGG
jgi:hypothetical protein